MERKWSMHLPQIWSANKLENHQVPVTKLCAPDLFNKAFQKYFKTIMQNLVLTKMDHFADYDIPKLEKL